MAAATAGHGCDSTLGEKRFRDLFYRLGRPRSDA
jgi:hypothetical protein